MDIILLFKSIAGLILLLGILVFLLIFSFRSKNKKTKKQVQKQSVAQPTEKTEQNTDLDYLIGIIKNKKSTASELQTALDLIIKHHGKIENKLGIRPHPSFYTYMDIIFRICRHPNTNKNIIVDFDKKLSKLNPQYAKDIDDALAKGLNSRGIN